MHLHHTGIRSATLFCRLSPLHSTISTFQDHTPHVIFCFGISSMPFTGKCKLIWKRCFRTTRTSRSRNTGVEGSWVGCMAIRQQCSWALQLLQASRPMRKLRTGPLPFFCFGLVLSSEPAAVFSKPGKQSFVSPDYGSSGQTCFPSWKPLLCFLTMGCHTGQAICFNYVNHFILFANIDEGASRRYRSKENTECR